MDKYYRKEIADKLGLPINTLIFLEEKGIVTVHRQENGYRYYDGNSIGTLMEYRLYRSYGFSLENILELWKTDSQIDYMKKVTSQIEILHNQIQHLNNVVEILENDKIQLEYLNTNTVELEEIIMPVLFLVKKSNVDIQKKWAEQLPIVKTFFEVPMNNLNNIDLDFSYGIFKKDYDKYNLSDLNLGDCKVVHENKKVLHGFFKLHRGSVDDKGIIQTYLDTHSIQRTGTIICQLIASIRGKEESLVEAWIPIE